MQTPVRARMQTRGRSHEQRRLWTPNKKLNDGTPFLLKDAPVRGLIAHAARLCPPPHLTVTVNFCCGWRGDTPFEVVGASGPCPSPIVPVGKMMTCMLMLRAELARSTAIRARGSDKSEQHSTHAPPKAIGSCGIGRRTGHPGDNTAHSLPLRKEHAPTAIPSGETTGSETRSGFFWKVEIPNPCFPCVKAVAASGIPLCWAEN